MCLRKAIGLGNKYRVRNNLPWTHLHELLYAFVFWIFMVCFVFSRTRSAPEISAGVEVLFFSIFSRLTLLLLELLICCYSSVSTTSSQPSTSLVSAGPKSRARVLPAQLCQLL